MGEGDKLEDILLKMDPEKRERLINSALEEFGNNKFDKASTNTIVKNAGISKGLLYHYFDSKESLYDYLMIFTIKSIVDPIMNEIGWDETDLINRIKEIAVIKLRVLEKYPNLIVFSKAMYDGKSVEDIKKIVDQYIPDLYYQVYHRNIDFSLFKDDIDVQMAINTIQWTVEKLSEDNFEKFKRMNKKLDLNEIISELNKYLEMLRKVFYK